MQQFDRRTVLSSLSRRCAVACLVLAPTLACGENGRRPGDSPATQDNSYYDLGGFHREVSTTSDAAQTWFDRGLAMCYAFNHEEAVRCFERALSHDPSLAMALWGMGYAWGPNVNNTQIDAHQIAQASLAVRLAGLIGDDATPLERDLIAALAQRYSTPVPQERQPLNKAYADAMRGLHAKYPHHPMVATLFAESLMILNPWKYWSPSGEPVAETPEIVSVLEGALKHHPAHPGLCHFYIHAMEASAAPGKALAAANHLRDAMPGAGHLVHMPSHIDVLLGDYENVILANRKAIVADAEFLRREGPYNFYTLYRVHNYHFLVYGAMFAGQSKVALRTAREMVEQIPEEMLATKTDFLDAFVPIPLHVLARFGRWEDILAEPEPADFLPVTRSMWHYARGLAYAATGRVPEAEEEQRAFHRVRATVPDTSILFNNSSLAILDVAEAMIAGEIAYRRGDFPLAFRHLREAVRRDDALNYDEPWGWMQPARHALGALLLEQGHVPEAESVYRRDLERHPHNPWALHGLAECLKRQGKSDEHAVILKELRAATRNADVTIDRSCYCRTNQTTGQP